MQVSQSEVIEDLLIPLLLTYSSQNMNYLVKKTNKNKKNFTVTPVKVGIQFLHSNKEVHVIKCQNKINFTWRKKK